MIEVRVILHKEQRYNTCGDWWYDEEGVLQVRVSYLGDKRMESCIALHEIVEATLCAAKGISQEEVDKFDLWSEENPPKDKHEPGDDINAPYYNEHQVATAVERLAAREMGLNWLDYSAAVEAL